jgi:hypothetical protein
VRRIQMMSMATILGLSLVMITFAAPASANMGGTVSCGVMSRGTGEVTISQCSDYANTGGSGHFSMSDLLYNGKFVVHWATGKATSVGDSVQMYIGDGCKATYDRYVMQGTVLKDGTGSISGPASASMCDANNPFKLEGDFDI